MPLDATSSLPTYIFLPDVIWMIKLRRMRWAGHVTCMKTIRHHTEFSQKIGREETI
jgi:hypothetical protein